MHDMQALLRTAARATINLSTIFSPIVSHRRSTVSVESPAIGHGPYALKPKFLTLTTRQCLSADAEICESRRNFASLGETRLREVNPIYL